MVSTRLQTIKKKLSGATFWSAPKETKLPTKAKSAEDVWSASESFEFAVAGSKYSIDKTAALTEDFADGGLSGEAKVELDRPVLFVHGFLGHTSQFDSITEQLTTDGLNGGEPLYILKGKFYSDPHCTKRARRGPEHKVFCMRHSSQSSPEKIASNLKLATKAINPDKPGDIDVAAHSLGGVGARVYCDQGNKIGKLAMLGTPNQGSRAGLLTKAALKNDIAWATSLAGVTPAAIPALDWLMPTVNGNEELQTLNSRWELQEQHMENAIVLGAKDFITPSPTMRWDQGDGLVETGSLGVGDVEVRTFDGKGRKSHYTMMNDPDFYRGMIEFFGWRPVS